MGQGGRGHPFSLEILYYCPRRDFAQKAKSREGTPVTRAYLQLKYTVSMPEKHLDLLSGLSDDVSIVKARK